MEEVGNGKRGMEGKNSGTRRWGRAEGVHRKRKERKGSEGWRERGTVEEERDKD